MLPQLYSGNLIMFLSYKSKLSSCSQFVNISEVFEGSYFMIVISRNG